MGRVKELPSAGIVEPEAEINEAIGAVNEREVKAKRATEALAKLEQVLLESVGLPVPAKFWMNEVDVIRKALG